MIVVNIINTDLHYSTQLAKAVPGKAACLFSLA